MTDNLKSIPKNTCNAENAQPLLIYDTFYRVS